MIVWHLENWCSKGIHMMNQPGVYLDYEEFKVYISDFKVMVEVWTEDNGGHETE